MFTILCVCVFLMDLTVFELSIYLKISILFINMYNIFIIFHCLSSEININKSLFIFDCAVSLILHELFPRCPEPGLRFIVVCGFLIVVAFPVAEHRV